MEKTVTIFTKQLPHNAQDLNRFIVIGDKFLKAHRLQLDAIEEANVGRDYYDAKLVEGQKVAVAVLQAQGKLRCLLAGLPPPRHIRDADGSLRGTLGKLPPSITKKQSHIAQSVARNPDIVEEVIEEARASKEIPTTRDVLERIRRQNKERKGEEKLSNLRKKAEEFRQDESVRVYHGDFRKVTKQFSDNYFDHIITDPPHGRRYLDLWGDLAEIAGRILKPGGLCIPYSGAFHLLEVMQRLSGHLEYCWQLVLLHSGQTKGVFPKKIYAEYKPILVFMKPPVPERHSFISDVIQGTGREKDLHKWAQGEEEMGEILDRFTDIGDLVLDPMSGSGTTLVSCKKNKRRCIGIEIEKENIDIIKGRLIQVGC